MMTRLFGKMSHGASRRKADKKEKRKDNNTHAREKGERIDNPALWRRRMPKKGYCSRQILATQRGYVAIRRVARSII
jgi:hypothetical protein